MELNELQKDYVKNAISQNRGSQSPVTKDSILNFAKDLGIVLKKNSTKESVLSSIFNTGNEDKFFDKFAHCVDVPFWDAAKLNNLTYKQVSDLDQLGVISALTYTGHKDATLYPLSVLCFKEGELLEIWNNKNKTDFFRTRIEVENIDDVQKLINEISKLFEVENVSKPYPHKENPKGCYIYFSIRSLNGNINNDNYKNEENAKLKLENSTLKGEIKDLNDAISSYKAKEYYSDASKVESLKKRIIELEEDSDKLKFLEKKIAYIEQTKDNYKNEITDLEKKLNNSASPKGGRPSKFTDQEKETMKMYRLQGKSIRKIAEIFNCSTGLVHKIVSE